MNLMDLLTSSGGSKSVDAMSKQLGIGGSDASSLIEALAPALLRGVQRQAENPSTVGGLEAALSSGRHQQYLDDPDQLGGEDMRVDGNKILGHLFGSKDVSRNVAAQAAQQTGLSNSLIKKALPMLAGLAMGALSKSNASSSGGLGDLLSGFLGGGGRQDSDGGLDDILDLAKKFL